MRVAIFTDETGWHTRQLQAALRARGAQGRCLDLADCAIATTHAWHGLVLPGYGKALPDAALVRGIAGGSFEQVTKRLGVLHALRALGVPVYNDPRAIERSVDKAMTSLLLHQQGLPTPPTWAVESTAQAQRILMRERSAGHALVLKPLFGSQGKGLLRLGDGLGHGLGSKPAGEAGTGVGDGVGAGVRSGVGHGADGPASASALPPLGQVYGGLAYLQRYLPPVGAAGEPGFDWRVLVIGGRARAAMRRVSQHWVHNLAQGARSEPALLTADLARLAEAAAAALQMDYAGVDIMPAAGPGVAPLQVIEVNGVAAWHGLQSVTGFNIARAIVDDLLDRVCAGSDARAAKAQPRQA